jgi:hypothetical protein
MTAIINFIPEEQAQTTGNELQKRGSNRKQVLDKSMAVFLSMEAQNHRDIEGEKIKRLEIGRLIL